MLIILFLYNNLFRLTASGKFKYLVTCCFALTITNTVMDGVFVERLPQQKEREESTSEEDMILGKTELRFNKLISNFVLTTLLRVVGKKLYGSLKQVQ